MTKRTDIFNQQAFEESLIRLGCPKSFIHPVVSNFRLFIPLIIYSLGEDEFFNLVNNSRQDLGLGNQEPAWREVCKYIFAWAKQEIDIYISKKK